jgi:hypothetical protein
LSLVEMTSRGPNWDIVIANLARHLASAIDAARAERILLDADRDLTHLRAPRDFWARLGAVYERGLETRIWPAGPAEAVRALLATRIHKAPAP